MIGYLGGTLLSFEPGHWVLGVGSEASGWVGYSLHIPARSDYHKHLVGSRIEAFVHTHVREDAFDLYGFLSAAERELFLTLLSVSGIGPRSALSILSHVEPWPLLQLLQSGEVEALTELPGIGKRTAERMLLELKDKLKKKSQSGLFAGLGTSADEPRLETGLATQSLRDAQAALVGLGFKESFALKILKEVGQTLPSPHTVGALVRAALKQSHS